MLGFESCSQVQVLLLRDTWAWALYEQMEDTPAGEAKEKISWQSCGCCWY